MAQQRNENLLLQRLPQVWRNSLESRMEEVRVPAGTVIYEADEVPRYAWFITSGLASTMVTMCDGRSVETGLWGAESILPCLHLLGGNPRAPFRCVVQVESKALRLPLSEMQKEMQRSEPLRQMVLRCAQRHSMVVSQNAACNRLHDAEQRLARWLLTARDLTGASSIFLSQGSLADILGARRTTVTLAAGALRRNRLISYRRSQIQILDAEGLREAACECYQVVGCLMQNL